MKNDDFKNQLKDGYKDQKSFEAIQSLKSISIQPTPYLMTRILHNLDLRQQAQENLTLKSRIKYLAQQFKFWPSFSVALATLLISFIFFKNFNKTSEIVNYYQIGQAYIIRVDIRPLPKNEIAYAEIALNDDNIEFTSQKYTELKLQKKLVVNWDSMLEKQYLPIVVKGTKEGSSKVIVNYYDSDHNLVTSQEVSLYFKGGA